MQALLSATSLSSGGAPVSIINRTVGNTGTGAATISVGYRLDNDGKAYKLTPTSVLLETWLDTGTAGQFEVQATRQSGAGTASVSGSALGTWLALSADRDWSISAAAGTSKSIELLVEIRDVATHTVQDSATITLDLVNTSGGGGGGGGGSSGGSVSIDDQTVSNSDIGTAVTARYSLNSDGNVYANTDTLFEAWLDSGVAGDFEARATLLSGTLTSGTVGSWQALSTTRSWTKSSSSGFATASIQVEIRDASSGTVLDSAIIDLEATAS